MKKFYKNLSVLVTGGAGFIGSHIVDKLVDFGAKVTVLDDLSSGKLENLENVINKVQFIQKNIDVYNVALNGPPNYIFNLFFFI